jgi:hypothetical protein
MKTCPMCKLEKPSSSFHNRRGHPAGYCKPCKANYDRGQREKNKERLKCKAQQRRYGITLEEKQQILSNQGGVCACCHSADPGKQDWHTDHIHGTKIIRGILCGNCNPGIGNLGDNLPGVMNAAYYLSKSEPLLFPGIWKRIAPPILNTNLKFSDLEMQKDCLKNKSLKEMGDNADIVAAPQI